MSANAVGWIVNFNVYGGIMQNTTPLGQFEEEYTENWVQFGALPHSVNASMTVALISFVGEHGQLLPAFFAAVKSI